MVLLSICGAIMSNNPCGNLFTENGTRFSIRKVVLKMDLHQLRPTHPNLVRLPRPSPLPRPRPEPVRLGGRIMDSAGLAIAPRRAGGLEPRALRGAGGLAVNILPTTRSFPSKIRRKVALIKFLRAKNRSFALTIGQGEPRLILQPGCASTRAQFCTWAESELSRFQKSTSRIFGRLDRLNFKPISASELLHPPIQSWIGRQWVNFRLCHRQVFASEGRSDFFRGSLKT